MRYKVYNSNNTLMGQTDFVAMAAHMLLALSDGSTVRGRRGVCLWLVGAEDVSERDQIACRLTILDRWERLVSHTPEEAAEIADRQGGVR